MSDKIEEWAQELKDVHGKQITTRLKRQIKKNTTLLLKTIRDKDIEFGEFSDEVNRRIANISYLRRVLRGMLSDDLTEYKDYLRTCVREGYAVKYGNDKEIIALLNKYDNTRAVRLRKIKGILLRKISKYSS